MDDKVKNTFSSIEKYQGLQIAARGCYYAHNRLFVGNLLSVKMSAEKKPARIPIWFETFPKLTLTKTRGMRLS